jgi:glyoxylate/hydroxypyruvate reductase A
VFPGEAGKQGLILANLPSKLYLAVAFIWSNGDNTPKSQDAGRSSLQSMTEILAIKSDFDRFGEWIDAFDQCDIDVVDWEKIDDPASIDYALVWKPEPGALHRLTNLNIIFSIGAGLDHLKGDNILPPGIPVIKMADSGLTAGMVEYVLYCVLRYHRFMPEYERQQENRTWHGILQVPAPQRTVGILGLGEIGSACARALVQLDFNVLGWSRSEKNVQGVTGFHGNDQLDAMLGQCDILVCLLPHTRETAGILNARTFAALPKGAFLVNAGRGGLQDERDIVEALNRGQLGGAALDVFQVEPLPDHSPLWNHSKILLTPHVASMNLPATSAQHVYRNIMHFREGQPLTHVADMERGY